MCKPNLRLSPEGVCKTADFQSWLESMRVFAKNGCYMKLSGAFSELQPQDPEKSPPLAEILRQIKPWTDALFSDFPPNQIMFGSDWPVCNIGGAGNQRAWNSWRKVVEELLTRKGFNKEEKAMIWTGSAAKAYGIES